jgi:hypothetical protein
MHFLSQFLRVQCEFSFGAHRLGWKNWSWGTKPCDIAVKAQVRQLRGHFLSLLTGNFFCFRYLSLHLNATRRAERAAKTSVSIPLHLSEQRRGKVPIGEIDEVAKDD